MVKRSSKRYLNTGNTIRHYHRDASLRRYQKYGCIVIDNGIGAKDLKATRVMSDVLAALPGSSAGGLELSLSKQRRWELPSYMKNKVAIESDSKDVQITVVEHVLDVPRWQAIDERDTCTSYYSNVGPVRECVSSTQMNIKSAKQGHREQDHLNKAERRLFKKTEQQICEDSATDLPTYECHIAYGARSDGKFFKDLATKGFANNTKKNRNHTSGWSKRFQSQDLCMEEGELEDYAHYDVLDPAEEEELTVEPIRATLGDFVTDVHTQRRKPRRGSYVMV